MKPIIKTIYTLALACCLFAVVAVPCLATDNQETAWETFFSSYYGEEETAEPREQAVADFLTCDGEITLDATPGQLDLVILGGITVESGGVLTLDNPNLVLMGPPPVITVKPGGTLQLKNWHALTPEALAEQAIVIEEDAQLLTAEGLPLPDWLADTPTPPAETLPPTETVPPNEILPPTVDLPTPTLVCTQWRLKTNGLLSLWLETEPCQLTENTVSALRIYRSADGAAWALQGLLVWDDRFCGFTTAVEPYYNGWVWDGKAKVQYYETTDHQPFYLRLEVDTPEGTVTSQPLLFTPPAADSTPPGGGTSHGGEGDADGSSGGRGGVQGEYEREDQQTEIPAALLQPAVSEQPQILAAEEPALPQETANASKPEQDTKALTEPQQITSTQPEQAVPAVAKATSREAQPATPSTPEPPVAGALPTNQAPPTAKIASDQPSGDRGPTAIIATLIVCGCTAGGLLGAKYIRQKRKS